MLDNKYTEEFLDLFGTEDSKMDVDPCFTRELQTEMVPFQEELDHYKENILIMLMNLIHTEIHRLPTTQRDVIIRHYIMGESIRGAAKALGINWYALQRRKLRAIRTLKKRLLTNPYVQDLYKKLQQEDPPIDLLVKIADFLDK